MSSLYRGITCQEVVQNKEQQNAKIYRNQQIWDHLQTHTPPRIFSHQRTVYMLKLNSKFSQEKGEKKKNLNWQKGWQRLALNILRLTHKTSHHFFSPSTQKWIWMFHLPGKPANYQARILRSETHFVSPALDTQQFCVTTSQKANVSSAVQSPSCTLSSLSNYATRVREDISERLISIVFRSLI